MAIPESQLNTWSSQGAKSQSASTYGIIKSALESPKTHYNNRNFTVFLQGSYGNDTNIYAESDVDVVMRYNGGFFHDLKSLSTEQQTAFQQAFPDGMYSYALFKEHVVSALQKEFGASVKPGSKAIKVEGKNSRRSADVVVAFEFRRYFQFLGSNNSRYAEGICFFTKEGVRIANYPKQHSENLTAKHQRTGNNFKPVVRIFKNMRSYMDDHQMIRMGSAPSYFLEGLLFNAPDTCFSGTYGKSVLNVLRWLHQTPDRSQFVCANEQFYLLRDNAQECWPSADGASFIEKAITLWDNWS